MKKSKFTEEQITLALHRAEDGAPIEEICRKLGISNATFYKWKQRYGGLLPSEIKKLKQLEDYKTSVIALRRLELDCQTPKF